MKLYIQWASIIFAAISSILWILSSRTKTPDRLTFPVVKSDLASTVETPGGTYVGHATCPELEKNAERLRTQARLNKWAALFTGVAIGLQAIYTWFS